MLTAAQQSTGNRFWQNYWNAGQYWGGNWTPNGIIAKNIFQFNIENATFRGYSTTGWGPGSAIDIETNRFDNFTIRSNTFINQWTTAVRLVFNPGLFDVNGVSFNGIHAGSMDIFYNFFGPQINTTTPLSANEALTSAIYLYAPNSAMYNMTGLVNGNVVRRNYIRYNIIDRAENGIFVEETRMYPLGIINNTLLIEHNNLTPQPGSQTGISLANTMGNKTIRNNIVNSTGGNTWGNPTYNIRCFENMAPAITCNTVTGGFAGFNFIGGNIGTWMGNEMRNQIIGLYLTGYINQYGTNITGAIGQQGNSSLASDNRWMGTWGGGTSWETWVDGPGCALNSPLYVAPGLPTEPMNNAGPTNCDFNSLPGFWQSLFPLTPPFDPFVCPTSSLIPRTSNNSEPVSIKESGTIEPTGINLYPNPTSGNIIITGTRENELLSIVVADVTGKTVFSKTVTTSNYKCNVDLAIEQGIYIVTITDQNDKKLNRKLIITK
jgi:hypothetical protein